MIQTPDDRLDELVAAYLRSVEAGERVDRARMLADNPDLADDLREFFADRDRFEAITRPLGSGSMRGAIPPTIRYVGDYELLEEIATGGMGVVYKARQKSLNRIVAVKMILTGRLASADDVERFQMEAEAAAALTHPNIVKIYEVGEHEGQKYFSMDFVDGQNLAELTRENALSPEEAARHIQAAATAIHYAHEQGVLHRDLKPSNILIDSAGEVRITDFGLAKRLDSARGLTITGQVLGTPSYMPPEQALAKHNGMGPAADVYSLGAILYELVTGRPPFRAETTYDTLRLVIDTPPVSVRLLNPKTPRDLDTICLKCLEKEPAARYASAEALAADLRRYLGGEPILARPVGAANRAWRWCRRRPLVASLIAALAITFIGGFAAVFWQWQRAEENYGNEVVAKENAETARGEAVAAKERIEKLEAQTRAAFLQAKAREAEASSERARAEQNLGDLRKAVDELFTDIAENPMLLRSVPGTQELRKHLLEKVRPYYERIVVQSANSPQDDAALAKVHYRLGLIAVGTGESKAAIDAYQRAIAVWGKLVEKQSDNATYLADLCEAQISLGDVLVTHDQVDAAAAEFDEAGRLAQEMIETEPNDPESHFRLARVLHSRAALSVRREAVASVHARFEASIAEYRRTIELRPNDTARGANQSYAKAIYDHANIYIAEGQLARGAEMLRQANAIIDKVAAEIPKSMEIWYLRGVLRIALGELLLRERKFGESLDLLDKAMNEIATLSSLNPAVTVYLQQYARALLVKGRALAVLDRRREAREEFERSVSIQRRLMQLEPNAIAWRENLSQTLLHLGNLHLLDESSAELERTGQAMLELSKDIEKPSELLLVARAEGNAMLGRAASIRKDIGAAIPHFQRAVQTYEPIVAASPTLINSRHGLVAVLGQLARAYEDLRRYDDAGRVLEEVRAHRQVMARAMPNDIFMQVRLAECLVHLGETRRRCGDEAACRASFREALAALGAVTVAPSTPLSVRRELGACVSDLSVTVGNAGDKATAQELCGNAIGILQSTLASFPSDRGTREFLAIAKGNLVELKMPPRAPEPE